MERSSIQEVKDLRATFGLSLTEAVDIVKGRCHEAVGTYDNPLTGKWQRVVDHYPPGVWWYDEENDSLHHFNGTGKGTAVWYDEHTARRKGLV